MAEVRTNRFKHELGRRQQLGIFSALASPALTEMFAQLGFDWLLLDTEHSPNEPSEIIAQLQVMAALPAEPIVRPVRNDMMLVKRWLDFGAHPYVQNAEEAARAVSFTRYPPRGVRGVSGSSRAAAYGLIPDYSAKVGKEICVIVQIETTEALAQIEAIAEVDSVDAVFIGPADLAASMDNLGNTQAPEVQAVIDDGFRRLKAIGKPAANSRTTRRKRYAASRGASILSALRTTPGVLCTDVGHFAYLAVEKAVGFAEAGRMQGIGTAPLNKEALNKAGYKFAGHTDMLASSRPRRARAARRSAGDGERSACDPSPARQHSSRHQPRRNPHNL